MSAVWRKIAGFNPSRPRRRNIPAIYQTRDAVWADIKIGDVESPNSGGIGGQVALNDFCPNRFSTIRSKGDAGVSIARPVLRLFKIRNLVPAITRWSGDPHIH